MKLMSCAAAATAVAIVAAGLVGAATGEGQRRSEVVDGCFRGLGPTPSFHLSATGCASGEHSWAVSPAPALTSASCPAPPVCLALLLPRPVR